MRAHEPLAQLCERLIEARRIEDVPFASQAEQVEARELEFEFHGIAGPHLVLGLLDELTRLRGL